MSWVVSFSYIYIEREREGERFRNTSFKGPLSPTDTLKGAI